MSRRVVIASQKGGVGKTTATLNLAALAGARGRVLVLDNDPIASVTACLGRPEAEGLLRDALPGVDVLPCPAGAGYDAARLRGILDEASAALTIIDVPPYLGDESEEVYALADELLVVLRAEPLSFRTLPRFLERVIALQAAGGPRFLGIVLTLPPELPPGSDWERALRQRFGGAILPQVIPWDEALTAATLDDAPVVLAAPAAPSALSFRDLAAQLALA